LTFGGKTDESNMEATKAKVDEVVAKDAMEEREKP